MLCEKCLYRIRIDEHKGGHSEGISPELSLMINPLTCKEKMKKGISMSASGTYYKITEKEGNWYKANVNKGSCK